MLSALPTRTLSLAAKTGQRFTGWLTDWRQVGSLLLMALRESISPAFYRNKASFAVLTKQIYFTALQILPAYSLFAAVLSFITVRVVTQFAAEYGLGALALELTVKLLILDGLPLFTAMFVALRSGAATGAEVAMMNVVREIESMRSVGVDPIRVEMAPRIIAATVSVFALSAIGGALALVVSYLALYGANGAGAAEFARVMAHVFSLPALSSLAFKVTAFGLLVLTVPIAAAMNTPTKLFWAPIALLRGMVRLFSVLMLIEALPIVIQAL